MLSSTQSLLRQRILDEREACEDATNLIAGGRVQEDLEAFYYGAKERLRRKVNGKPYTPKIVSDTDIPTLNQLLFDEAVRIPIQPMSRAAFSDRFGLLPESAAELARAGLVVPAIRHRQLEAWAGADYSHLEPLLQLSTSPGDRYEQYLRYTANRKKLDYEGLESKITDALRAVVDTSVLNAVKRYEGGNSTSVEGLVRSFAIRILGVTIEDLDLGGECMQLLGNSPEVAAEGLPQIRVIVERTIAPRLGVMNGTVSLDPDNQRVHADFAVKGEAEDSGLMSGSGRMQNALVAVGLNIDPWPIVGKIQLSFQEQRTLTKFIDYLCSDECSEQRQTIRNCLDEISRAVSSGISTEAEVALQIRAHNRAVAKIAASQKRWELGLEAGSILERIPSLMVSGEGVVFGALASTFLSVGRKMVNPSIVKGIKRWRFNKGTVTHRLVSTMANVRKAIAAPSEA